MRTLISALIIDPCYNNHNYDQIYIHQDSPYYCDIGDIYFDIKVIENDTNIQYDLYDFRGVDSIITIGDISNYKVLYDMPLEIRKKWSHIDEFHPVNITNNILNTFIYNIDRPRNQAYEKLFSIFTCTYNTSQDMFDRLYNSLLAQTYNNWNWFILDDSPNDDVINMIESKKDSRITVFKNISNHGNIGFNKRTIAMACNGDYLVEIDHDDEIVPHCLEKINQAFYQYPDTDFVYSHVLEELDGREIYYGESYAHGLGQYRDIIVQGQNRHIALTPNINALSVRSIYSLPNHVRCWKAEFYRKIGGHNPNLSVLDDMELLIRTFLHGTMTLVDDVLYIQHEGNSDDGIRGSTTQSKRFKEIQRTNNYIRMAYDKKIHDRVIELCGRDWVWNDEYNYSILYKEYDIGKLCNFNHILK